MGYNGSEVMGTGDFLVTIAKKMARDTQAILSGVRSSLNYSIDNLAEICDDTGGALCQVEEDLELAQGEIDEVARSLDKLGKVCAQSRSDLLDAVAGGNETTQRKALEKLERLLPLKGQFTERENALQNRKTLLQGHRRAFLDILQRTENTHNKLRLASELLFSDTVSPEQEPGPDELRLATLALQFAEQEKLRLARELHDGPAQLFAAAILMLELVQKLLSMGETDRAHKEVGRVKEQLQDSLGEVRSFLLHLNPQALDEGLRKGLIKLAERINVRKLSVARIDFIGSDAQVSPVHAVNVFRIVQEAVNNAIKNGKASSIRILVTVLDGELKGYVEDNGCGFEVEAAKRRSRENGSFGLSNMEERAKLIGGTCTLESTPGKGSIVTFRIPIDGGGHIEKN